MTSTFTLPMSQKLRGALFLLAGAFFFLYLLDHSGMLAHLVSILGLSVADVTAIVNAVLTGTISSLPTTLQGIALAYASLITSLVPTLGVSGVIAL